MKKGLNKEDFFRKLTNEGISKISGIDENFKPYRIIEYRGKKFKLTFEESQ